MCVVLLRNSWALIDHKCLQQCNYVVRTCLCLGPRLSAMRSINVGFEIEVFTSPVSNGFFFLILSTRYSIYSNYRYFKDQPVWNELLRISPKTSQAEKDFTWEMEYLSLYCCQSRKKSFFIWVKWKWISTKNLNK